MEFLYCTEVGFTIFFRLVDSLYRGVAKKEVWRGMSPPPQNLADQLTLFKPGGRICQPPGFKKLSTPLWIYCTESKFFTYVTKTRPNLPTYSRKLENYNGTIIFEIDIIKKSSPINSKFTFLPLSKPLLLWYNQLLSQ